MIVSHFIQLVLASSFGVASTFYLIHLNVNSILASALIGFIGSFITFSDKKRQEDIRAIIYCSSFSAIGLNTLIVSKLEVALLPLLIVFLYNSLKSKFIGLGGKLGSIAFVASVVFVIIQKVYL